MENIRRLVRYKTQAINNKEQTFESLFEIIHDTNDKVFSEITDGFKIKKITYGQIKHLTKVYAKHYQQRLKTYPLNSFIGILMENSPEFIILFWALLMIGYRPVLMNVKLGDKLNINVCNILNLKCLITNLSTNLPIEIIYLDNEKDLMDEKEINSSECIWANEIALTTSATSLNMKVCIYDGKSLFAQISNSKSIIKQNSMVKKHYKGSLKLLAFLPFYHIFGLIANYFWFSLFNRTFVFLKDYSSDTIINTIKKHEVTHVFAVPIMWNTIVKKISSQVSSLDIKTQKRFYKAIKFSLWLQSLFPGFGIWFVSSFLFKQVKNQIFGHSIKFMITGGSDIKKESLRLINGIGYPLYNGYGMTEIGIGSVELRKKAKYRILGTIGKPFNTIEYSLNDDRELMVRGSSISRQVITKEGTWNNTGSNYFYTGDIIEKKGKDYYIRVRKDDLVITESGENVNPNAIEEILDFRSANCFCVLGLKNNQDNETLDLIIEIKNTNNLLYINNIINEIENNLKILSANKVLINNIYLTYNNLIPQNGIKVSRGQVRKQIENKAIVLINYKEYKKLQILSDSEINQQIINLIKLEIADVLHIEIDIIQSDSHFIYDLSGTSLDYFTLLMRLKEEFNMEFMTTDGYILYTPKELGNYIQEKNKEK